MPSVTTAETETAKTPETTPPPAAQEAAKTPPAPTLNMLKILGYEAQATEDIAALPEDPPAEEPKPETPAAEVTAPPAPEGEKPAAEEQPRVKKKPKASAIDKLPSVANEATEQPKAEPETKAPEPSAIENMVDAALKKAQVKPEENLAPEDLKAVELAAYAAQLDPVKYGDLEKKEREFIAARNAHISQWVQENGVAANSPEFAEYLSSAEYRNFVRANRPVADRETIKEKMIEERALARARAEQAKQKEEFDRKLKSMELRPVIESVGDEAVAAVLDIDDDAVREFKADPEAAMASNPIEAPIIHEMIHKSRTLTTEYLSISEGLIDADANNPLHVELDKFIAERGQQLDSLPEDKRTRNGHVLVSPAKYREMVAKRDPALSRYETFSKRDVANLIRESHKAATSAILQQRREALGKAGYTRVKPNGQSQPTPAPAPKVETPSPKAISTRAPGPSGKPAGKTVTPQMKALGYA